MSYTQNQRVSLGVEIEFLAVCNGMPYDLKTLLHPWGGSVQVPGHGAITTDLGWCQGEFVTVTSRNAQEMLAHVLALEDALHRMVPGLTVRYMPHAEADPYPIEGVLEHPYLGDRIRAQLAALIQEAERDITSELALLGRVCSTHVHVGRIDEHGVTRTFEEYGYRDEALTLMNVFTNCGPYWAQWLVAKGARDDPRRQRVWFDFTVPARQPRRGTWLYTWDDYECAVQASGPRLVRPEYDPLTGRLVRVAVDLETRSDIHDPAVLKTQWTQGRLSPFGTIESRACPSAPPWLAARFAEKLVDTSDRVIGWVLQRGAPTSWDDVCALYGALRESVQDFVPHAPLGGEEWARLAYLV